MGVSGAQSQVTRQNALEIAEEGSAETLTL